MAPKNRSYVRYQKVSRDDDGFVDAQVSLSVKYMC